MRNHRSMWWPSPKIMGMRSASISSLNSAMKSSMVSLLEEFICAVRPRTTTRTVESMSDDQLQAFLKQVKADVTLQEKVKAASDADAVVAIAKDAGFAIAVSQLEANQVDLSDEELEGLSGGLCLVTTIFHIHV